MNLWLSAAGNFKGPLELHTMHQNLDFPELRTLLAACVFGSTTVVDLLDAEWLDRMSTTGKTPLTLAA